MLDRLYFVHTDKKSFVCLVCRFLHSPAGGAVERCGGSALQDEFRESFYPPRSSTEALWDSRLQRVEHAQSLGDGYWAGQGKNTHLLLIHNKKYIPKKLGSPIKAGHAYTALTVALPHPYVLYHAACALPGLSVPGSQHLPAASSQRNTNR